MLCVTYPCFALYASSSCISHHAGTTPILWALSGSGRWMILKPSSRRHWTITIKWSSSSKVSVGVYHHSKWLVGCHCFFPWSCSVSPETCIYMCVGVWMYLDLWPFIHPELTREFFTLIDMSSFFFIPLMVVHTAKQLLCTLVFLLQIIL